VLSKKSPWNSAFGYDLEYKPLADNVTMVGGGGDYLRALGVDLDSGWHSLVGAASGTAGSLYVDGVELTTDPTIGPLAADGSPLQIGREASGVGAFLGSIDEVRISGVRRSAGWIAAQHRSMTDAFVSFGAEELPATLSATASVSIQPRTVEVRLDTVPPARALTISAETATAPIVRTLIVGSALSIEAPDQPWLGVPFRFSSWSDGGAQAHLYVPQATQETVVATFVQALLCADGIDNDGDGRTDYPADRGCRDAGPLALESPACQDGIDNDRDSYRDFPADRECAASWGTREGGACGLGAELIVLAPLLATRRRRARAGATRAAPSR
jgi:hypothetical protein